MAPAEFMPTSFKQSPQKIKKIGCHQKKPPAGGF
jgi:hypothetical protein